MENGQTGLCGPASVADHHNFDESAGAKIRCWARWCISQNRGKAGRDLSLRKAKAAQYLQSVCGELPAGDATGRDSSNERRMVGRKGILADRSRHKGFRPRYAALSIHLLRRFH